MKKINFWANAHGIEREFDNYRNTSIFLLLLIAIGNAIFFRQEYWTYGSLTLVLFLFLFVRPHMYAALLLICLGIFLLSQHQFEDIDKIRWIFFIAIIALSALLTLRQRIFRNPIAKGLALIAAYSICTAFLSYYPVISLLKGVSLLLMAGFLLFVLSAIQRMYPRIGAKEYFLRVYLYFTLIVVISNAIYFFVNPSSSDDISGVFSGSSLLGGGFRGWFLNPNSIGAIYGIFFIPILWSEITKGKRGFHMWAIWGIFLIAIAQLLASRSRAGVLAGIASMLVLIVGRKRGIPRIVAISLVAFLAVAVIINDPGSNIARKFIYKNEISLEGSGRLPVWIETLKRITVNPLLGSGLGVSDTGVNSKGIVFSTGEYTIEKGNSYLGAMEELGLLGLIGIIVFLLMPISKACWKGFSSVSVDKNKVNLTLIAIIIAGLVNAIFEAWLLSIGSLLGFSFWIFASLLLHEENGF